MAGVKVIWGKATLDVQPFYAGIVSEEKAVAVLRALWSADGHIKSVKLDYNGMAEVDVVVPVDGSLNLDDLQKRLQQLANDALGDLRKRAFAR